MYLQYHLILILSEKPVKEKVVIYQFLLVVEEVVEEEGFLDTGEVEVEEAVEVDVVVLVEAVD